MNVSKTPTEMGWAKISCCKTEFLDMRRQDCSTKANQRPVDGCVSPPSAPASHTKLIPGPKKCHLLLPASPVLSAPRREANVRISPQVNKCILAVLRYICTCVHW